MFDLQAVTECAGAPWWCTVPPNAAVHYSTPAHCARYPPEGMPATSVASCYLTFAKGKGIFFLLILKLYLFLVTGVTFNIITELFFPTFFYQT